jgi:hypothetical protein
MPDCSDGARSSSLDLRLARRISDATNVGLSSTGINGGDCIRWGGFGDSIKSKLAMTVREVK